MKALGLVVSDKKIFENLIVNPVTYDSREEVV